LKPNYAVIPLILLLTSLIGSQLTRLGMEWYRTIALPSWTPSGAVIGAVWTFIFILVAVSALLVWNARKPQHLSAMVAIFVVNLLLNNFWSYLFFVAHMIGLAMLEMVLLNLSTLALMILSWPTSRKASILLAPYFLWVCFATYLTMTIWSLNAAGG